MNLICIKNTESSTKKKKGKQSAPRQRFEKYWRLVQKNLEQNESLKVQLTQLKARYIKEVLPTELALYGQIHTECYQLMDFFTRKSLCQWERAALAQWIGENIELLLNHPYYPQEAKSKISADFMALLAPYSAEEEYDLSSTPDNSEELDAGAQDDLFAQSEYVDDDIDDDGIESDFEDYIRQSFSDEEWAHFQHQKAVDEQKDKDASRLLKSSSINTMFRRIARILHPDLDTDSTKKEEKHLLMSKLIKARENKDIATIFLMYREFVSELPMEIEDHEVDRIVELLQHQISKLEMEREDFIYDNPETEVIFALFDGKSQAHVSRKVNEHIANLKLNQDASKRFVREITSIKKLKPYLEERYYTGGFGGSSLIDFPF